MRKKYKIETNKDDHWAIIEYKKREDVPDDGDMIIEACLKTNKKVDYIRVETENDGLICKILQKKNKFWDVELSASERKRQSQSVVF
jgi:3,4-dihydroxy-2-butanone 4-phosphate synthase